MNSRSAAKRVVNVMKGRLPMAKAYGPSRRIEDAWVRRETQGTFAHGIAIVIDSGLNRKWIVDQVRETIKTIHREPSLNRARRGVHIWDGDNVSRRYRDEKWQEDLSAMDTAEVQDCSLEALEVFARTSGADQIVVLTTVEKLRNSDKRMRMPSNKLSVIFPTEEEGKDTYRINRIPCFGVQEVQDDQEKVLQ